MINQDDARQAAKKLDALISLGRKHDIAVVRYKGKYIAQFGIRRGSREESHSHISRQLYISQREALNLCKCPLSSEEYFKLLEEKKLL